MATLLIIAVALIIMTTGFVWLMSRRKGPNPPIDESEIEGTDAGPNTHPAKVPTPIEFFFCTIEDLPASITTNLWYEKFAPIAAYPVRFALSIEMAEPGESGMGAEAEAEVCFSVEDLLEMKVVSKGIHRVGRIRNNGRWTIYFYGKSSHKNTFNQIIPELENRFPGRNFSVDQESDPGWIFYRELLYPDAKEMQWILDRRVVENLMDNGDSLTKRRSVDHFAYFTDKADRDAFQAAAEMRGFQTKSARDDAPGEAPYSIEIAREEEPDLPNLHEVAWMLKCLAKTHNGDYDGWGTVAFNDRN